MTGNYPCDFVNGMPIHECHESHESDEKEEIERVQMKMRRNKKIQKYVRESGQVSIQLAGEVQTLLSRSSLILYSIIQHVTGWSTSNHVQV